MEAFFVAFLMPTLIVGMTLLYSYKKKQLNAAGKSDPKELERLKHERKQLEARVQNLESIVCSVEFELNARLNRLAATQSAIGALPPAKPKPALLPAGGAPDVGTSPTVASPMRAGFAEAPLAAGERIAGRYTLERELGHGGMGFVFLARDEQLGERVALKVISQTMAADPAAAAERFRREVAAARKITHPNVIRIHDLIEDGARLLLSMEYVDGMTLAAYLGRVGALRIDEARHLLAQICDGLGAAHAAGVIHRDLKPGNVLVDGEKRVKVIDFGLAKASFMAGMTATGLILGTPEYMAPEQVRGLPCDTRTDLYSLGALAYHLLVGRPPFAGETPIAIGFAHVTESPRPPRELRPELPASVETALLKALAKDPADRFLDANELKRALTS
ncbi:MAG TPA: protein kinase [Polyangia bacterium]|nr:protein kinase [Polyangia bacterium]